MYGTKDCDMSTVQLRSSQDTVAEDKAAVSLLESLKDFIKFPGKMGVNQISLKLLVKSLLRKVIIIFSRVEDTACDTDVAVDGGILPLLRV